MAYCMHANGQYQTIYRTELYFEWNDGSVFGHSCWFTAVKGDTRQLFFLFFLHQQTFNAVTGSLLMEMRRSACASNFTYLQPPAQFDLCIRRVAISTSFCICNLGCIKQRVMHVLVFCENGSLCADR